MNAKPEFKETATPPESIDIQKLLTEIDRAGVVPKWILIEPGMFMRAFYEQWHENGKTVGGRYRNSVRRMRDTWLTDKNLVRSIHAKLIGRVKLSKSDTQHLIDLFLQRWEFVGTTLREDEVSDDGYKPFPSSDRVRLCRILIKAIFNGQPESQRKVLLFPKLREEGLIELHDDPQLIEQFAWKSNAFIIISRQRTVIGPSQPASMMAFWHMVNEHFEYCRENPNREKINIWILDAGTCSVEDDDAFSSYYNTGFLALLFRMIKKFSSADDSFREEQSDLVKKLWIAEKDGTEERWQWLARTSIIAIQNIEREEFDGIYSETENQVSKFRLNDIHITKEHIFPSIIPQKWSKSLKQFYKSGATEDMKEMTVSVSYKDDAWDDSASLFRYFAHSTVAGIPAVEQDLKWGARSLELGSPGQDYDEAFRLLYLASKFRLQENKEYDINDESISFAYLRKLGFQLLKLDEFLQLF